MIPMGSVKMNKGKFIVGELIKELEKLDKDKPVEVSVTYDNCEHIQPLSSVYDFNDSYFGDGWVTLRGGID